jgi:hypothetical protein
MTYNAQCVLGLLCLSSGLPAQRPNLPRPSGTAWQSALRLGDAGWGGLVRQGKYRDRHFADVLVEACVRLVQEWNPQPAPNWVTCIPSIRHPDLVPDFARRLAAALNLLFHWVLEKTTDQSKRPWPTALNRLGISMVRCGSSPGHCPLGRPCWWTTWWIHAGSLEFPPGCCAHTVAVQCGPWPLLKRDTINDPHTLTQYAGHLAADSPSDSRPQ